MRLSDSDNGDSPQLLPPGVPGSGWTLTLHIRGENVLISPELRRPLSWRPGSGESRGSSLENNNCERVIMDTVQCHHGYLLDTVQCRCHLVTERTGGDQQRCTVMGCAWLLLVGVSLTAGLSSV